MFEKLWEQHVICTNPDGTALLYIDRHFLHEGSRYAFEMLRRSQRSVRRPEQTFACADHFVPTSNQRLGVVGIENPEIRRMVELIERNTQQTGVTLFGLEDERQGIVHVVGPEQGLTHPGLIIVCGDSHTSTHGAFGALAFGIGHSEVAHVLATQTLWQTKPRVMRVSVEGPLGFGLTSKDLVLSVIGKLGADGGTGFVIEFAGSTIRALSMEARMTICNMSIEAGARAGLIAPDERTFEYLKGRPFAPSGEHWDRALELWRSLPSDPGAVFDREVSLDGSEVVPTLTWGTSPEDAVPIDGRVPDPSLESNAQRRARLERALAYMGLEPGTPVTSIPIDRVFIGSCTNARIEDLRAASLVAKGRKVKVPAWVVPGSRLVKRQAEAEGLDRIFLEAGFEWRDPGCSMCLGVNNEILQPGERCAATSNRNFEGRQGKGGRTHLMSPTMAAAAAITGHVTDVRELKPEV